MLGAWPCITTADLSDAGMEPRISRMLGKASPPQPHFLVYALAAQAVFKYPVKARLTLNSSSSCLCLLGAGIPDVCHPAWHWPCLSLIHLLLLDSPDIFTLLSCLFRTHPFVLGPLLSPFLLSPLPLLLHLYLLKYLDAPAPLHTGSAGLMGPPKPPHTCNVAESLLRLC